MPLPNVNGKILAKVIEYCKFHVEALSVAEGKTLPEEETKAWDNEFVKVDQSTLFELILVSHVLVCQRHAHDTGAKSSFFSQAANYLNIKDLLDLTCSCVANMIKGNASILCFSLACERVLRLRFRQDSRGDPQDV